MKEKQKDISYKDVEEDAATLIDSLLQTAPGNNSGHDILTDDADMNLCVSDVQRRGLEHADRARKDRIVYLILLGKNMADPDYLFELATELNVIVPVLMRDISELSDPDVWAEHIERLRQIKESKRMKKAIKLQSRKKEVASNVLQLNPFNEIMFLDFSMRFDCTPRDIFRDIQQFKSFRFWYSHYMSNKSIKVKTFAIIKYARIHLAY
ncbi:hypothetical protein GCM10011607_12450 [Shewanella inventionis]|uniref:Uncharacterized protein n=1 Tax=Shewanella inventionis TaxID=1738770 RepID=A0ABQ1IYP1_9GAMM|nr:hypothetical protein [Shewanella inventionis]GGB53398.1 hypothetical protein GCM10011607_12450 [Shewanella inventionis]